MILHVSDGGMGPIPFVFHPMWSSHPQRQASLNGVLLAIGIFLINPCFPSVNTRKQAHGKQIPNPVVQEPPPLNISDGCGSGPVTQLVPVGSVPRHLIKPLARSLLLPLLLLIWEAINLELVYICGARLPAIAVYKEETDLRDRNTIQKQIRKQYVPTLNFQLKISPLIRVWRTRERSGFNHTNPCVKPSSHYLHP